MRKVLVLEDEENIRSFVVINLKRAGYETIEAGTGEEALAAAARRTRTSRWRCWISCCPDIDGFEVCRRIRAMRQQDRHYHAHRPHPGDGQGDRPDDRGGRLCDQALFPGGADRPGGCALPPRRRRDARQRSADEISQPPFLLNTRNRTLEKNGQRIKLTQVEYSIIKLFMDNPGKALSREEILDAVWGKDYFGELKIVDVNIRRLRIKIEDNTQQAHLYQHSLGLWL